jgi:hypothetical protein
MTDTTAPDLTPGYPSNGTKLGPAWRAVWAELDKASQTTDPFLDGRVLADNVAPDYGLSPATLVALLSRAAKAGLLNKEARPVESPRGYRMRTHYKVPANA